MAAKEEGIELDGIVLESVKNGFRVEVAKTKHIVFATLAGKMRLNNIRVVPGDVVKVEVSPYDLTRGRIIFRNK